MVCSRCSTNFCWLCGEETDKSITPTHFSNGRCAQFSNAALSPQQQAFVARWSAIAGYVYAPLLFMPIHLLLPPVALLALAFFSCNSAAGNALVDRIVPLQALPRGGRTPLSRALAVISLSRVPLSFSLFLWLHLAPLFLLVTGALWACSLPLRLFPWLAGGIAWALPSALAAAVVFLAALPLNCVHWAASLAWFPVWLWWVLFVTAPCLVAQAGLQLLHRSVSCVLPSAAALVASLIGPSGALAEPSPAAVRAVLACALFYFAVWLAKRALQRASPNLGGGGAPAAPATESVGEDRLV